MQWGSQAVELQAIIHICAGAMDRLSLTAKFTSDRAVRCAATAIILHTSEKMSPNLNDMNAFTEQGRTF